MLAVRIIAKSVRTNKIRDMENSRVSVITPCYNSEKTIRRTMESVLEQTYSNIEYIIVDGGSTDGTVEIIREYQERFHGRLKYVSEKDSGIYNAMNKGIRMTTGSVIGIINSDDYYEPDAVEKVVCHMTDDPYQVLYGYCNYIKKSGIVRVLKENHKELDRKMIPHLTCFVTRRTYCRYGMFVEWMKIAADYELMLRLSKKEDVHFIQIQEILANFCEGGISTQSAMGQRLSHEQLILRCMHGVVSKKEFLKAYLGSFNQVQSELASKHFWLFMLMNRWVEIKQEGKNIADYLEAKGYYDIAVYGMSYVGERLLAELRESRIHVKYGIDRAPESVDAVIPMFSADSELEPVDAVIVTPIYYFQVIREGLVKRLDCPILSLEDILYDMGD